MENISSSSSSDSSFHDIFLCIYFKLLADNLIDVAEYTVSNPSTNFKKCSFHTLIAFIDTSKSRSLALVGT